MRKSIDTFEEHYRQVLERPEETGQPSPDPAAAPKDEVDDMFAELLGT